MEYKIRRTDRKLESAGSVLEFYRDTMILPDGTEQKWDPWSSLPAPGTPPAKTRR